MHARGAEFLRAQGGLYWQRAPRSSAFRPTASKSHDKFKCKYGLALRLVADEDKLAANAYGVWGEKSMFGKKYMGVERSTFLIGRSGRIVQSWRKVSVAGHADEVLAAVKASAD